MSGFFVTSAIAAVTSITAVTPDGGEYIRGSHNITWSAVASSTDTVSIALSSTSGSGYNTLINAVNAQSGTYSWDTTAKADAGTYRLKVTNGVIDDVSDTDFTIDNTDPVTTFATSTSPDGINGWYITVPTITLSCNDGAGSGCNKTYYRWDSGAWVDNSVTPVVTSEGSHLLEYYSDDNATDAGGVRNIESFQTQTIKVDTIFPSVVPSSTTADGYYNAGDTINVTLTYSEAVSSTDALTVNLNSGGSCVVPILTNTTTGNCTYTVLGGENSSDLTVNSIVPLSGVVEDIAGNDSTLVSFLNIANTSAIVVDTTAPSAFTVGTVTTTGGTIVSGWWNSTNTGVTVEVPFANDSSLTGGVMQLQADAGSGFENIGPANEIFVTYLGTSVSFPLTALQIEAITGFSDGDNITFRAIITDIAGNSTTGANSADTFTVDQTAPTVDAGTDKEVSTATTQNAITSDPLPASGIATWAWTANSGNVNFTPASTEDTDIFATVDGTYTVTLTVTDNAGNSNSDTVTFVWDTTDPVLAAFTLVSTPTNDTSPSYTFSVDKAAWLVGNTGTINITGSCGAWTPSVAVDGNNTVTFTGPLSDAMYTDCDITVTDAAGNTPGILAINDFEIDTIMAAVSSITTTDANLDGTVDTATIVFTDEMKDSTFVAGDFTIGGIPATIVSTGDWVNDNTFVLSHAGVAGTESKTVTYVPGTVTDLAGNVRTAFTSGSIDAAKPVLLSARTINTTTVEATFSEDLNGSTVNGGGGEFTVAGYAVSAASETAPGVVTLTVATMPTDAIPLVTYTQTPAVGGTLNDLAPFPNTAVTPVSVTAVDGVAPTLSSVTISSDNDGNVLAPEWAMVGNTATLTFTSSESIATPTVLIDGMAATMTGGSTAWTATYTFVGNEADGTIPFSIAFADLAVPTPNTGTTVTATNDLSSVFFDEVAPTVDAGTDKEVNALVNQLATTSDPAPASGIATYLWQNMTLSVGTITFGTNTAEDTTISADTEGTYTIRLIVIDNAGNVAFDEMTFIWDTTNPVAEALIAPEPQTGVLITAGTAKVRFDEPIVLLATSRVVLKNNSGTSYKGTVAVDSGDSKVLNIAYSGLDYGTVYDVIVKPDSVRDVAGNNVNTSFTAQFTTEIDTVVPVVNSASASGITTTSATLNVTTDEAAYCHYSTTDSEYNSMTAFGGPNTPTSHMTTLTGLTPSTGYDFYVRCVDTSAQANTMTTSAHISFTTATPDTSAPIITNIQSTSISQTGATITWNTDENATSRVQYGLTSAYGTLSAPDLVADLMAHLVPLTGLTPGTTYHFRVLSNDAVSNAGTSVDGTFTTNAPDPDTATPPVPSISTGVATVNSDSYTISGTAGADTPVNGVRTVSVYNGATLAGTAVVPIGQTGWSVSVTLTQNVANSFTAISTDASGNSSAASSAVVITEDETVGADLTPPDAPVITTTTATVDNDTYEIAGTSVNDGVRTIVVEKGGSPVGTVVLPVGETVWAVTVSLSQNTDSTFTAYAYDEAGNKSLVSNSVTITEAPTLDTTKPVITLLGVNPQTLTVGGLYIELGATASDNVDGNISSSLVIGTSTVNMAVAGTYTVTYNVSDTASNSATQETRTVIVNPAFDDTAELAVTGISTTKSYATDDNTFANGWSWTFLVTVPTAEVEFAMKFADFVSGANTISAASNIRYYSAQASANAASTTAVTIAGANTYPGMITLDGDLDAGTAGRQIAVTVEMKVPVGSAGGSYSASYGVNSDTVDE